VKLSDVQAGRIGEYLLAALPLRTKPLPGARLLITRR
jgi:hypothetical protein